MNHSKKDIYTRALRLAVPMMIQNGITNMVGLVDNLMVGSLGTEAMTAVSIVGQLIFVFNLAIFGGISGPGIYGAQFFGQKNEEGFRNTFRMKIWISLFCLICGLTLFISSGATLIGLYLKGGGTELDPALTLHFGEQYLYIMLLNLVPFIITQIYASSLRETGNSFLPMISGVCSVLVDVLFNYLLIFGKFGFPKLGVSGAAIATVLARIVEMGIIVIFSHIHKNKYTFLKGIYKTIFLPIDLAKKMLKKGLPIFVNEFLWAAGMAAMTQCYSLRGLEVVAGLNISNAICNLLNVVFVALGGAVGVLIGQTLGEGHFKQAKKDALSLTFFSAGICCGLTVILVIISGIFPDFYRTSEHVKAMATQFIIINALFFPVQGLLNSLYFTLRSGGKTLITFLFDSVFSWVVSVPLAFCLCKFTGLPINYVFFMVLSADFIKVIIGFILVNKGVWINLLI